MRRNTLLCARMDRMRRILVFSSLLALLLPVLSMAQVGYGRRRGPTSATATSGPYTGPAVTFQGTVKSLSKKELTIDVDAEEQSLTFRVEKKTKFLKDGKEIKLADITEGTHVSVDATREGDQKLSALNVMVAPSAKTAAKPDAAKP
jgi:hypothetical protein